MFIWVRDPYMQYFCGAAHFQHKLPFDPSDFVHFRKRIGLDGVEKIFKHTVTLHGEKATSKMVLSDTTVQENFVTYPTDAKQYKTIEPLLEQMKANEIRLPQEVVCDSGGKGEKEICGVKISMLGKPKRHNTSYEKRCKREKFRRRAAIEPIIGHLKSQFRMGQNYLSGRQSPQINAFLSAAAWNLKKLMEQLIENGKKRIFTFLEKLLFLPIINFKIAS